jgi:hypothetical protein
VNTREPSMMPRQGKLHRWDVAGGVQGLAAVKRQALTGDSFPVG